METRPYFYLLRTRLLRQVQFRLADISFRYRDLFMLPGQPEESMAFMLEIHPLGGGHSYFGRVGCDAILGFASSSAFPPHCHQGSYDGPRSEVGCARKHFIGFRGGLLYLWGCSGGNSLYFRLADCGRRISSIGMFIFSNVRR